jgi:hypothetical protein
MVSSRQTRGIALVVLGLFLFLAVAGAHAAIGAERTVLNEEFVTEGLEEEGFYEAQAEGFRSNLRPEGAAGQLGESFEGPEPPVEEFANSVVTPEYVQTQFEGLIGSAFAYLHGDVDELNLTIDTTPIKAGFVEEFETWIIELDPGQIDPRMGDLAQSESSFEQTRTEFKDRWLQRIQQATPEQLSQAELEAQYDQRRGQIRQEAIDRLESRIAESGGPPEIQSALVDYGTVGVDALVSADADYETFLEDESAAREALATAVGDLVSKQLDEAIPDQQNFAEGMDEEARGNLEDARGVVTLVDTLALLLPLAAIALAALIVYVSGRRSNGLWRVGGVVAVIGLGVGIVATLLSGMLPGILNIDPETAEQGPLIVLGLLTDALGTIGLQSWLLLLLGLVLVAAGIAIRRELLPIEDEPTEASQDESRPSGEA